MDFTRKYRPTKLGQLVGQKGVVSVLKNLIGPGFTSGSILLHGPPGVGKTTVARIIAMSLNCEDRTEENDPCGDCKSCRNIINGVHPDVMEVNAAKNRGINEARAFDDNLAMSPMIAPFKVLILDEAHALTKEAQDSLLKPVEEPPRNVCILLCSTEPKKIKKTIRDRCKQFKFGPASRKDLQVFLSRVASDEGEPASLGSEVLAEIAEAASGSPRVALNKLQQFLLSDRSDETRSDLLSSVNEDAAGIMPLCRKLCYTNSNTKWLDIVKAYKDAKESNQVESIRIVLCGYIRSIIEKTEPFNKLLMYSKCLDILLGPLQEARPENAFVNNLFKAYSTIKLSRKGDWGRRNG